MSFTHKRIHASTDIGRDLEELRLRMGWTCDEASARIKIPAFLIRAWEAGTWGEGEDMIHTERLLLSYVECLGGKRTYFLQKFRECLLEKHITFPKRSFLPVQRVRTKDLMPWWQWLTLGVFGFFLVGLGWFIYVTWSNISQPPFLLIEFPRDGERLTTPRVRVVGNTIADAFVTVNGRQILIQQDGKFETEIYATRGTTLVQIEAKKRYSKTAQVVRRVLYEQELPLESDSLRSSSTFSHY